NGKRGTYALMADGSVRWIADTIPDATFQALVTRAGDDAADDLGAHSQIVPPPAGGAAPAKPTAPKSTAAPAAAGPAVTGWKESNSAEGGYSVSLPTNGKVLNSKQTVQLPTGQKLEFNTNGVEFTNDSGMMVAYA